MSLPLIIGIAGHKGSGKDTLAQHFVEAYDYERVAFADRLKAMALAVDPIVNCWYSQGGGLVIERLSDALVRYGDEAKNRVPEVRRLYQRLGTEAGRGVLGENVWVEALFREWDARTPIVIPDVRFPNEVEVIHEWCGVVVVVQRPHCTSDGHASEDASVWEGLPVVKNAGSVEDLHLYGESVVRREMEVQMNSFYRHYPRGEYPCLDP